MSNTFKDGMTMQELKDMKVKLSPSPYDKAMHFDLNVKGEKVEALENKKVLENVVNYNLKAAQDFIPRLPFAEVLDPFYTIRKILKPVDLKVRVFGSADEADGVAFNWQLVDIEEDIKKMWGRIARKIAEVQSAGEVSDNAEKLLGSFEATETSMDSFGTWVTVKGYDNIKEQIVSMTGISEAVPQQDGSIVLYFKGKYMTFTLKSGEKVFFILRNPSTGMKGETEELFKGVFFEDRYYSEKL